MTVLMVPPSKSLLVAFLALSVSGWILLPQAATVSDDLHQVKAHEDTSPIFLYSINPGSGSHGSSSSSSSSSSSILMNGNITLFGPKRGPQRVKRSADPRGPYTKDEKRAVLDIHNEMRGFPKAADMLPLEWDKDLEQEAQRWADRCDFSHPTETRQVGRFKGLGQNLYVSTHESKKITEPVQKWYDEVSDYTYSSKQCAPSKMCGHYTQVVWAKTESVGCAIKWCDKLTSVGSFSSGYIVVCEYGPPGNYIGQFPYQKGGVCSKCPGDFKYCAKNVCSVRPAIGGASDKSPPSFKAMSVAMVGTLGVMLNSLVQLLP